jgi:hypothetical protein
VGPPLRHLLAAVWQPISLFSKPRESGATLASRGTVLRALLSSSRLARRATGLPGPLTWPRCPGSGFSGASFSGPALLPSSATRQPGRAWCPQCLVPSHSVPQPRGDRARRDTHPSPSPEKTPCPRVCRGGGAAGRPARSGSPAQRPAVSETGHPDPPVSMS